MATTKVKAETCRGCSTSYKVSRPKCLGEECAGQRAQYTAGDGSTHNLSGICIICCFTDFYQNAPRKRHQLDTNTYLCYYCGRTYGRFLVYTPCTCCPESFLCSTCCENGWGHKFCCKRSKIEFRNRNLVFAYPAREGNMWRYRDDALDVLTNSLPITRYDPKGFSINDSKRFASAEIEVFDYKDATNLNKVLDKWYCSVVHDSSILRETINRGIRPTIDKTFEINTSPACGNKLYEEIKEVSEALAKAEATPSLGCGLHVHVDCRDFSYQDIHKLIRIYYYIEEALFAAVHWTRYTNDFCKPCGEDYHNQIIKNVKPDTKDFKAALIKSVYGPKSLDRRKGVEEPDFYSKRRDHYGRVNGIDRNEKRYSAINLHSYFLRGTVESRIHHGSNDFEEIYNWVKLQVDLFDAVYDISDTKLNKMLEIAPVDLEGAKELVGIDRITRRINKEKLAAGVVVLRSLLPDASFQNYLNKVMINCHDEIVSVKRVLPCQKGKFIPTEQLAEPTAPLNIEPDPNNIRHIRQNFQFFIEDVGTPFGRVRRN